MSDTHVLRFEAELRIAPETGSWTVFDVPGSREHFGTGKPVRTVGTVDGHEVAITLMPTGNGAHVGPVKATVRRAIGKQAGERVLVELRGGRS